VRVSAAWVACVALLAGPARALEQGPHVRLDSGHCAAVPAEELRRMLAAELGATVTAENRPFSTQVRVDCDVTRATLVVHDPLSRKSLRREIGLDDLELSARGRLLAIAAAELVTASWAELEVNPSPRIEPSGPTPPLATVGKVRQVVAQQRRSALERRARAPRRRENPNVVRALAVVSTRRFFEHEGAVWGGGVRAGQDFPGYISWTADALFETGEYGTGLGRVGATTGTFAGALYLQQRWPRVTARAGGGLRAGWVSIHGPNEQPNVGASKLVPWGWPLGVLSVSFWPSETLVLELLGESSYAKLPLTSGARLDDPALRGMWVSVQLAAGVRLNP
jgi:hypothetical protein